jgi:hypothetical protein
MAKKPKRLLPDVALEPFFRGVDDFCDEHLPKEEVEPSTSPAHKIIADPVGGYCSIDSWEVSIIDTPLFQRLRGIRQLGLAYLVYPTLGYSRFEHLVGVRARLDQIVTTLRQNQLLRGQQTSLPTEKQLIRVRLAALCHDIGHCLFSHVSESIVESLPGNDHYPRASAIMDAFESCAGRRIPMAEMLSVAILTSPSFIDYLHRIGMPALGRHGAEQIAFDAAHLTLGLPIPGDATSLFLAQLMNSGLDIDKLDYMLREALLSGISLGISLQWLMKKLFIAFLPGSQLPHGLLSRLKGFNPEEQFTVLSLERGGQFAFEEFCVARLALHEKIYLHQKIRAAEVQTKTLLAKMARSVPSYEEVHRWLYLYESMTHHPDAELPALPKADLFNAERPRHASDFDWYRIRDRQLLARAYAFGWQNSIADPLTRAAGEYGVDTLMKIVRVEPDCFTDAIRKHLRTIVAALAVEDVDPEAVEILVDPPRLSTIQQGQDTIHIEYPSRLSLRWTMPIDLIEDYYSRNRALGYVFTARDHIPYVLLAAEKAAWDLCGVVCAQEGLVNKEYAEQCNDMRAGLDSKGFYTDAPPLRPMTDYLASVEAQMMVTQIAEKLSAYESKSQKRVTPASVTTFVAQFPANLQEAALAWLRHIDFVRPEAELKSLIPKVVREHLPPSCKSIGISPLGATTDSAYHLSYNLREPLREAFGDEIKAPQVPLAEALSMKLDAYVVFDDNTNSGLQPLNIVAGWLDKQLPEDLQLTEEHVQPLPKELHSELLSKPLVLVFSVATEGAPKRLRDYLVSHCDMNDRLIKCIANREFRARGKIFSGPDSAFQHADRVRLREFLADVAKTIFISEGKSEAIAKSRALGDRDAEAMAIFPYNCPTMTIPALWLTGRYGTTQWIPLVERGRRTNPVTGVLSGEDA